MLYIVSRWEEKYAEMILNEILNTFNETSEQWKTMLQRCRSYFAWNSRLKDVVRIHLLDGATDLAVYLVPTQHGI